MHILDILLEAPTFVSPCMYNILISILILYVNNKWENRIIYQNTGVICMNFIFEIRLIFYVDTWVQKSQYISPWFCKFEDLTEAWLLLLYNRPSLFSHAYKWITNCSPKWIFLISFLYQVLAISIGKMLPHFKCCSVRRQFLMQHI